MSHFTLRIIIILMETIKDLYQTPTPPAVVGGMHRTQMAVERGCDRVAGEDEGRGRACIALPRAGNRTRLGSQARPEKKEPPVPAARSVKQGGVKVQRWLDDAPINDRETLTRF